MIAAWHIDMTPAQAHGIEVRSMRWMAAQRTTRAISLARLRGFRSLRSALYAICLDKKKSCRILLVPDAFRYMHL
jgi:hypothetical protein